MKLAARIWLGASTCGVALAATGCSSSPTRVRGAANAATKVQGSPKTLAQALAAPAGTTLMVRGAITQKCPVAGCWFELKDKTGVLRVDTKVAGFTVGDIALRTPIEVQGKVVKLGSTKQLQASSIRY
jgi:uncharacterized protein YdeI (BOF family)